MHIVRYTPSLRLRWDEFVKNSSNATFLHLRGYMDYHADRFTDCSLMAFDSKNRLVAILPANISGTTLYSHQGLTYGGWLTNRRHFATPAMLEVWNVAIDWMRQNGITEMIYKAIPCIYVSYPSDDDVYALFRLNATVNSCAISSAIPLNQHWLANESSRQLAKLAANQGVTIESSNNYHLFMKMLSDRLLERYGITPVHSSEEMSLLASRFPENIKLFLAFNSSHQAIAGTIIYITNEVVHTQYIATTSEGRRIGAVPAIVNYLMCHISPKCKYLDFGTSCEENGLVLNKGLVEQKYGLGGRPVAYTSYRLKI